MSGKFLILVGALAGCGYALSRTTPPVPPDATAADTVAVMQAGIGARMTYGVGAIGSKLVGSTVQGMVRETEQSLEDLRAAIKAARGPDGARAKQYAAKVTEMNERALLDLQLGHPIAAVQTAMEAKSVLNSVRGQIKR